MRTRYRVSRALCPVAAASRPVPAAWCAVPGGRCPVPGILFGLLCVALVSVGACRRSVDVPPETYREAVVSFHTALAAMETSQELLAREHLDRVVALVPQEPAGWANLGLLLLRQQEIEPARAQLARASSLAPEDASIVRLQALVESRAGELAAATRFWRRAVDLAPSDPRAAYALAQDVERQGTEADEAEAQRVLEQLLARTENLPARLDLARIAAKRGDGAALASALQSLQAQAATWPDAARERLASLAEAAAREPRTAATQVAFLRNVLVRELVFRRALAQVTTPLDAIGEPLRRFVVLPTPEAAPAEPDTAMTFVVTPIDGWTTRTPTWVGATALTADAAEAIVALDHGTVYVAPARGIASRTHGATHAALLDIDSDFRMDAVVGGEHGLAVLQQDAEGQWRDVTAATALPQADLTMAITGVWAADVDLDGDLDIVVARRDGPATVLRNNGDGTFLSQPSPVVCSGWRAFAWADVDGDGVPDAACLGQAGDVRVALNLRGGAFEEAKVPAPAAPLVAMDAADVSGDGRADIVGVTGAGHLARLSFEDRAGAPPEWRWQDIGASGLTGLDASSATVLTADLDNNAALDIVVASAAQTRILLGGAVGRFTLMDAALAMRADAVADLDEDGRVDLAGRDGDGHVVRATSTGTLPYHWQRLRPRAAAATGDQRVNAFGIGGEVEVRTGLHAQTRRITSPVVHIGLGTAEQSQVVRILWPNGVLQSEFAQQADTTIRADQRLKGSCPWLFAWDGEAMSFVTDLIWRSPLGLRINAQATADVAMTEDWVKVGGTQLRPRDGAYDLRITAELWETHFFDTVSLLVVDHPADTEVFVDERFSVPGPALEPVVTGLVQPFADVRDDGGRDAAATVARRDDVHLDFAGRGRYQGVTRQHAVEFELPASAPREGELYLVAHGWVHPTDSSINVALSQGRHAAPAGLALDVADAAGTFRPARTGLGFPAGKDKTILVPLHPHAPATGPRRFRLTTNLEVFWDRLGWAVGRPDVSVTSVRVPLAAADLRYRGFSETPPHAAGSPERPRYRVAGVAPRWLDLEGFHTRFGDVRPLLGTVDDRYVIMNAGDELALRFTEAPPVAAGHTRDFIVVADGWVKDGDYNTTASRTVLPLPTHASGRYDRRPATLEDDPVYRQHAEDFATYHTRYVAPAARAALRGAPEGARQ